MNTPLHEDDPNLRYAEYVLGVLDADEHAAVEREIAQSAEAAAQVTLWRRRLLPLAAEIAALEPPPRLWQRIRTEVWPADTPVHAERPAGLWDNVRLWHWLGLGAGALAAACIVALVLVVRRPAVPSITYMASTLAQKNGNVGWTATMDLKNATIIIVPAAPQSLAVGRAPELWLIPRGENPIPVGMISTRAPVTLPLGTALRARIGSAAILAVSVEPPGGSPTGQPTGAVIATGAIASAGAGAAAQTPASQATAQLFHIPHQPA